MDHDLTLDDEFDALFFYLSGANFEDCVVTYEIAPDKLTLWIPYVEPRQILWFGSKPSACECLRRYDVDQVRYTTQLSKFLKAYAASPKSSPTVYILHPDQAPDLGNGGDMTKSHMLHLDHALLKPAMDRSRLIKTDHEVALIRRANDISSAAHRRVAENMLRLSNERQIEAIIQAVCIANGARSQAYPIIAGSGRNASTLHYTANNAPLEGKQSVVIDAGCEWECYASDITRTLPLSGSFTPRAGAIHAIVQRMQDECIREVRPGKLWREIHLLAASIGLDGLLNLGILKGHRDEIARAGTVAAFFPHGLGHHVGLDVHDVSSTLPLAVAQAGLQLDYGKRTMVTPAIYFCREYLEGYFRMDPTHCRFIDWDILEGYYEVGGVRIEDCILVTEDGHENLTAAPKGDELLDVINKGRR
ncbi:hypothetical protein UVI_02022880 [Ustilaginoidea virens]|uniref:Xaa-Pro aminopeptidase n=1 Tax=Ustilaginoidea virens TaxID=1159556 RepID=A0A1B5L400_USTVR|nr:hypothetical protein UVI_02022880 [Ustilaginoidea virens]